MAQYSGDIRKMHTEQGENDTVQYQLPIGDELLPMNALIGQQIGMSTNGEIHCIACGRATKKSFQGGYCFPCMRSLPETDQCIVRPELCHFHLGTCRDAEWGQKHCMQDHILYFANSSGLKVGITRGSQVPTRWMDQGATQALPVLKAPSRFAIGQLEVLFKGHLNDRTDWRKMLKGVAESMNLAARRDEVLALVNDELSAKQDELKWQTLPDAKTEQINYPVLTYPEKVSSINLDKTPLFTGNLQGIKGQYLIFDIGVINMRKYAGYNLSVNY